jgi:ATP-dependent helicase HrpB
MALLAGYGDRVAKRRRPGSDQLVLAAGGSAVQSETSVVRAAPLCVVLDAREQRGRVIAHLVSAIEAEWLLELFPDRVQDVEEVVFDDKRERVELSRGLRYGGIMLDESRGGEPDPERAAAVLAEVVLARGLERVADLDAVERFERRVAHAARLSDAVTPLPQDARQQALRAACTGCRTLSDVDGQALLGAMQGLLPGEQLAAVQRLAPEQVTLPSGRKLRVRYEPDRPPWVASRLQDFFGSADGPRLGGEPLVLHLLAPNQRAVQVTTDLAGFWKRHYPDLRKQLMRRYPKHAWPEDPLRAEPPKPRGRRRR